MLRRITRHLRSRNTRGSAVMEAALVLPVIVYLTFGCAEYGYFLYMKNTFQGAAREGARAAIVATSTSEVTTAVQNVMNAAGVQSNKYTVTIQVDNANVSNISNVAAGKAIFVTVSGDWGPIGVHVLPTYFGGIPNSKDVVGTAVMRRE